MPLGSSASFLVRMVQLRLADVFKQNFLGMEITPAGLFVFALIVRNAGIRPGEIAEQLQVKPSNIAALVNGLVATGLVRREVDATELRASVLQATEAGLDAWEAMRAALERTEAEATRSLEPVERTTLIELLRKALAR